MCPQPKVVSRVFQIWEVSDGGGSDDDDNGGVNIREVSSVCITSFCFVYSQHPFIRDVKGNQAIMELVSEANAEIILEEKDLDDVRASALITPSETVYIEQCLCTMLAILLHYLLIVEQMFQVYFVAFLRVTEGVTTREDALRMLAPFNQYIASSLCIKVVCDVRII